eukprot:12230640-Alexandrium_andersonii.AAC.1
MLDGPVLRRRPAEEPAEQPPATRQRMAEDPGAVGFFAKRVDFANRVKARKAREAKGTALNYA